MIRASDDGGTLSAPTALNKFEHFLARLAAGFGATRKSLNAVDKAHASRRSLATFTAEEFEDTGVDPSDATGIASWQPDLPFFMQSGFGQR